MQFYRTKNGKLSGVDYRDIHRKALVLYKTIRSKTKRQPYIRSAYFNNEKVFIESFWRHLNDKKNFRDKMRRIKYFPCAIELIKKSRFQPISKENPNKKSEILHRFTGITKDGSSFFVQIKEDKKSGNKWFISVFPWIKRKKTLR